MAQRPTLRLARASIPDPRGVVVASRDGDLSVATESHGFNGPVVMQRL